MRRSNLRIRLQRKAVAMNYLSFILCVLGVSAVITPASPPATAPAEGHVQKTELGRQMEEIDEAMKKLRRLLRKSEGAADSLEQISRMEKAAVAAKGMVPSKAASLPEADRPKFVAAYRKGMAAFVVEVCHMESAVIDGDAAKAQEIFKNLKTIEDEGHDHFMEDEDKK